MKTTFAMESHTSPAPGIIPEPSLLHHQPAASAGGDSLGAGGAETARTRARRTPLARMLAAVRGDKYMVDAYPPAEPPLSAR